MIVAGNNILEKCQIANAYVKIFQNVLNTFLIFWHMHFASNFVKYQKM